MDLHALHTALGNRFVTEGDAVSTHALDSSRAVFTGTPLGVVFAESTADVSTALAWAHAHAVPVSVRGAGTGLTGGAVAYDGGLIVSLERMTQIIEIDPANRIAVVEAGVINADLTTACTEHGLFFPPDPASSRISTIGGNIATNAGGLRCVAHGVTSDWIAGLTVVLADGRIMQTGARTRKNVVGYDLTSLFVGSEGTLGIVTQATVRLKPLPEGVPVTFWADFDSVGEAGDAVVAIVNSTAGPEVLELMDAFSVEIIESFNPTGIRVPKGALLVGQTAGSDAFAAAELICTIAKASGAVDAGIAATDALIEARRLSNPALNARGLKISCDVGVPVSSLAEMFRGVEALAAAHGIRVSSVAHAGDGNLHCTVESPDTPAGIAAADALIDDITRLALSLHGTITGEHGIGSVKQHEVSWQLDEVARDVQFAIKGALDPRNILTPGRGI
ncbi:FAD-binding oxidoreductase [Leucobacter sp. CX42]|uniref:FAD-binding oxidoreductase n=1 Tax=unclassified Leucobacter TaxID=2621730 RepID=UPI00333E7C46